MSLYLKSLVLENNIHDVSSMLGSPSGVQISKKKRSVLRNLVLYQADPRHEALAWHGKSRASEVGLETIILGS